MSNRDLVKAAERGERVTSEFSLFKEPTAEAATCRHYQHWRTIACDGDTDVVECGQCGTQRTLGCNFDEDMS